MMSMISNLTCLLVLHFAVVASRSAFWRNLLTNVITFEGEHDAGKQIPLSKVILLFFAILPLEVISLVHNLIAKLIIYSHFIEGESFWIFRNLRDILNRFKFDHAMLTLNILSIWDLMMKVYAFGEMSKILCVTNEITGLNFSPEIEHFVEKRKLIIH